LNKTVTRFYIYALKAQGPKSLFSGPYIPQCLSLITCSLQQVRKLIQIFNVHLKDKQWLQVNKVKKF